MHRGGGAEILPIGLYDQHSNPWLSATYSPIYDSETYVGIEVFWEFVVDFFFSSFPPKGQELTATFHDDVATDTAAVDSRPSFQAEQPQPQALSRQDLAAYVHPAYLQEYQRQQEQQAQQRQEHPAPPQQQPRPWSPPHDLVAPSAASSASIHAPALSAVPIASLAVPSPHGLPIYSASGFDILSILSRVASRPNPRILLGPVDLTCSFVVSDARAYDHPIIYCSPTFCQLTGYAEREIVGRNCRFLQSPDGVLAKGEARRYTSPDAVAHLYRNVVVGRKECQTSIVNYKKGGAAFINLVTVIPVPEEGAGDEGDAAYFVGFQVNLNEQPAAILQRLQDGSYMIDYSSKHPAGNGTSSSSSSDVQPGLPVPRERRGLNIPPMVMSKELRGCSKTPSSSRAYRSPPHPTYRTSRSRAAAQLPPSSQTPTPTPSRK